MISLSIICVLRGNPSAWTWLRKKAVAQITPIDIYAEGIYRTLAAYGRKEAKCDAARILSAPHRNDIDNDKNNDSQ